MTYCISSWTFLSFSEPSFQLQMCVCYSHPGPGTTHAPPYQWITGGLESPGPSLPIGVGFKSNWKETLCFQLPRGPTMAFCNFFPNLLLWPLLCPHILSGCIQHGCKNLDFLFINETTANAQTQWKRKIGTTLKSVQYAKVCKSIVALITILKNCK
jgi:hypothetical protein